MIISDTNDHEKIANDFYYFYKFQNIRLEQNEKFSLPIYSMEVPYRDIYHCRIDHNKPTDEEMNSNTTEISPIDNFSI